MYNLTEAKKQFIRTGAYLATSMGWNDEAPPTEKQVERWRESAMTLLNQQKAAHKEISTLQAENDELKENITKYFHAKTADEEGFYRLRLEALMQE